MLARGCISLNYRGALIKVAITAIVVVIALLRWDVGAAFFLALLIASICGLIDGRVSVALGLLSLACCPLLLVANHEAWLQQSSLVNYYVSNVGLYSPVSAMNIVIVWAFYFICIGIVAHLVRNITVKRFNNE